MNEIPSEMLRGHIDTIILLCLTECDMHTNQIKDEIEKRAGGDFQLKQGTFYSALQRIVKQGYVKEYRITDANDGVRRKFYQLNEKGKNYIDENKHKWTYSREMINVLIETPKSNQQETAIQPEAKQEIKTNVITEVEVSPEEALEDFLNTHMSNEAAISEDIKTKPVKTEQNKQTKKQSIEEQYPYGNLLNYAEKGLIDYTQPEIYINNDAIYETPQEKIPQEKEVLKNTDNQTTKAEHSDNITSDNKEEKKDLDTILSTDIIEKIAEKVVNNFNQEKLTDKIKEVINEQTVSETKAETQNSEQQIEFVNSPADNRHSAPAEKEKLSLENEDFYNGEYAVTQDYKTVLSRIFEDDKPKKEQIKPRTNENNISFDITSDLQNIFDKEDVIEEPEFKQDRPQKQDKPQQQLPPIKKQTQKEKQKQAERNIETDYRIEQKIIQPSYDFGDIQSMADKEGFTLKISSAEKKHDSGIILINKLLFHTALTFFIIILLETILIYYSTKDIAKLTFMPYGIFIGIMALLPISTGILYLFDSKKKVSKISTFKSAAELLAIIMLNLILILIVCCVLANIDFSDQALLMRYVIYPVFFIINLPIYLFIKYLKLDKNNYYI